MKNKPNTNLQGKHQW